MPKRYSAADRAAAERELRRRKAAAGQAAPAVWKPVTREDGMPSPQQVLLDTDAYEIFFGGSAGGGKTAGGIGLAVTQHTRSIFFRRNFKHLTDAIEYSHEVLDPTEAVYNAGNHTWHNIPGGRSLEFAHVVNDHALDAYKGRPHDLKIFDEVSDFPERYYTFLSGWTRTTNPKQKLQVLAMGNPPTEAAGEWVIQRWAAWLDQSHPYPALPEELRYYVRVEDKEVERESEEPFTFKGEVLIPKSRTFIPARLSDNPYYSGGEYESVLQSLPEPLRSQLLYGDFSITATDDRWQVIPTASVQAAQRRHSDGEHEKPDLALRALAADIAHGGDDKTVIARLFGVWFAPLLKFPGAQTPDGETALNEIVRVYDGKALILIDSIGYGASAYDLARSQKLNAIGVNFGVGSYRRDNSGIYGFANLRAEAYWKFREALEPGSGEDICLPPDRELLADLCAPRYEVRKSNIIVEPKESIKKRIGRSPDCGDAVVMAWYGARLGWSEEDIKKFATNKIDESQVDKQWMDFARKSGVQE